MRTIILKRASRAFRPMRFIRQSRSIIMMAALLLATANLFAGPTVNWLSGGPNYGIPLPGSGYVDGDITTDAEYHSPCGIAIDQSGNYLLVADRDNDAVRVLEFDINYCGTLLTMTNYVPANNLFSKPVGVAIDSLYNIFVLNRGKGTNGTVLEFDYTGELIATNISRLTNAAGIALDVNGNIYVTASNRVFRVAPSGVSNVVATVTAPGSSLQGIIMKRSGPTAGLLAVCDAGRNGILLINPTTGVVTTNAGFHGAGDFNTINNISYSNTAKLFQPSGVAEAGDGTLIVSDYGNHRVKAVLASGTVTNLYGVTSNDWVTSKLGYPGFTDLDNGVVHIPDQLGGVSARQPFGVVLAPIGDTFATPGDVYVTEDYYHIIRHATGTGLQPPLPPPPTAPGGLTATAGYGQVSLAWPASAGATNYNIKRSLSSGGPYTNTYATTAATTYTDTNVVDGTTYYYVVSASNSGGEGRISSEASATPLFSPVPTIVAVATNYGQVSLTWSTSVGASSYNVKRAPSSGGPYTTIASPTTTTYTDTSVINGTTYYYVVSAVNTGGESANSAEVSATPPIPPPAAPRIGWFDYEGDNQTGFFTVLYPVSSSGAVFHNDVLIAIDPTVNGLATYYTVDSSVPSSTNGSTPPYYQDGLSFAQPLPVTIVPDLVIKAVNVNPDTNGLSSPITTAQFIFQVANPTINGNNAARFTVTDLTRNVEYWYTIDGTSPTNASPSIGPIATTGTNGIALSLNVSTNILFQVRAFRNGYYPSGTASELFSPTNFVPNTISFGFVSGEASSVFIAAPGQAFYAPVTLSLLPGTVMDSLQFNMSVNSIGASPAVIPGALGFQSMLMKPIPNTQPVIYTNIPPAMYVNGGGFTNLYDLNTNLNSLAVGWLERAGKTNLFDTTAQNLVTYSIAHDDMFPTPAQPGKVIVGGYMFRVPATAAPGDTYQIQIGRPSATTDGVGEPGSSVFIYAPTNGSLGAGTLNTIKNVTVGGFKYIAGDSAPFGWFNAGDFGNSNLDSADVAQVFEVAAYGLGIQLLNSDLFDSMDSCGYTYIDNGYGYLQRNALASTSALFDGNDATIDQIAFGDGKLDVADVYVTFRRSLQTNLVWFRRFWTNDIAHGVSGRVAEITTNVFNPSFASRPLVASKIKSAGSYSTSVTNQPKVNFTAADFVASSSQVVAIPITAQVFGSYPLRMVMLNLNVAPLDGSPALTTKVSFTPDAAFSNPTSYSSMSDSHGNGNYALTLLPVNPISQTPGLTGNVVIGTLYVTIPTNADSSSAYAVVFDHASASPNGLASFPNQTKTGLITLADRSGSSFNDGIPDSWRLRYFLTLNNVLSATNADADGDGCNNLQEYLAGTDPTDPKSFFKNIGTDQAAAQQPSDCVISWPSVSDKQYVIERSPSLSTPFWTSIATNNGTGSTMEYHDATSGGLRFYRVRVQ